MKFYEIIWFCFSDIYCGKGIILCVSLLVKALASEQRMSINICYKCLIFIKMPLGHKNWAILNYVTLEVINVIKHHLCVSLLLSCNLQDTSLIAGLGSLKHNSP